MNISQALKNKNRLVGEYNRLKQIFLRENMRRNDNPSKVDPAATFKALCETSEKLSALKAKIAAANVPIYAAIEQMSELKTFITFLQSVPNKEGVQTEQPYGAPTPTIYTWTSFLNQEKLDQMIAETQEKINELQDKIDAFNASTQV